MNKYFKHITLLFAVLTIIFNSLSEAIPINGVTSAQVSAKYQTLFTPAGYVFAIWGVIYIGWLAYAIYPYLNRKQDHTWMLPAFPYFVISAIANMLWLVLFHYEQIGLSVLVILVLLGSLIQIYRKLEIGIYPASAKTSWMVHVPMSIYLGWVSVATIANISAALVQVGWNGFGLASATWAIIMILVAAVLGCIMLIRRKDFVFVAVLLWAFWGINVAIGNTQPSETLVIYLAIAMLLIMAIYKYLKENR